jgi:hypothetical protein
MLRKLIILSSLMLVIALDGLAQGAAPPAKAPEDPKPAMSVPASYRYDSRARRDPFVNPVPKPPAEQAQAQVPRPPGLKGVATNEVKITGLVWSAEAPELTRAMIAAPGGKTYFARKGDALFDAVVKDIRRDGVVFELSSKDREGRMSTREVVRKIGPTP